MTAPNAVAGVEKRDHSYIVGGNVKMVQPIWKIVLYFHKNLNMQLPLIPILGIYPKEMKTYVHTKTSTLIYSNFICNSHILATTQMVFSGSMVKQTLLYPQHWILLCYNKEEQPINTSTWILLRKLCSVRNYIKGYIVKSIYGLFLKWQKDRGENILAIVRCCE